MFKRIENITTNMIELNKNLNERNNTLVQDVSSTIHDVLHDTSDATQELQLIQNKKNKKDEQEVK